MSSDKTSFRVVDASLYEDKGSKYGELIEAAKALQDGQAIVYDGILSREATHRVRAAIEGVFRRSNSKKKASLTRIRAGDDAGKTLIRVKPKL